VLENSNYKLYYDSFIITDRPIYNNRPGRIILDKTVEEAYLMDVAFSNNHSTITEKLQKYTDLKEDLKNMETENGYVIPSVLSTTVLSQTNYTKI
jgi:hypothetical protein